MIEIHKLQIKSNQKKLVDIAFTIKKSLALVGESGSGKSLTLKALLGMLSQNLSLKLELSAPFEFQAGKTISLVVQNPFTALSPLTKIKDHFLYHERAKELLDEVELEHALLNRYPPELSGGQLQRIVLALALEAHPKLLLLDEPTTALDPNTTTTILNLLKKLQAKMGFYMLFVTHDIMSAKEVCHECVVLQKGSVVEMGKIDDIIANPKEPYTKRLILANFATREFRK